MNKMTVGELKKILEKYNNEHLVIIDHLEGYICPNLVNEVKVKPVEAEEDWDGAKGELKIVNNSSGDFYPAIHISLKD
ncbi:hypothetical protein NIES4102_41520 (plasmid) [Chondrocystis sp. NIES-4102]|nr:hypothetical protein NIES4102_41520 [Chondrocystis sp. NIES-4102]